MLVLCLSFAVALSDQFTKDLVRKTITLGDHIPVIPNLFDLRYIQNTGAAWGMFQGMNTWLVILSIIMLAVLICFRRHFLTDALIHRIAIGFMIGGIVGNMIDRLRYEYVVDFLDFYWGSSHFPAFNIADSAICLGVGFYMIAHLFIKPPEEASKNDEQKTGAVAK